MRHPIALALPSCILWAASASLALAQTPVRGAVPAPGASVSQVSTLTASSTLVLVPALVRNKAGDLVFTLEASDFALTDDGVPQKLTLEPNTGGEPLALVICIEGGGAGVRELDKYTGIAPMIGSIVGGVPHKVAVVGFDSSPVLVQDFTADDDAAGHAIQALIDDNSGDGKDAILDALGFSVNLLRKQPPQYRRAILLVSETIDHGSKLTMSEALRAISDTNTAIYAVAFSTGGSGAQQVWSGMAPATPGAQLSPLPEIQLAAMGIIRIVDALKRNTPETVAHLTGGEYFPLGNMKSLGRDLQTISNHIPNRYMLSFQPQSPHPGFHAIRLSMPGYAGLKVSARDGYWAETAPPAAGPSSPAPR